MARTAAQKRKQKPDSAYYIKMSDAVPPVVRRSASCAVDSMGNLVKTNRNVANVGKQTPGPVRKVQSGDELIEMFSAFAEQIANNGFDIYPTKRNFASFIGVSYAALYDYLYTDYQNKQEMYKAILADILTEGMSCGAYKGQGTIFALKNWCGWADRVETTTKAAPDKIDKETADRLIKEYISGLDDTTPRE